MVDVIGQRRRKYAGDDTDVDEADAGGLPGGLPGAQRRLRSVATPPLASLRRLSSVAGRRGKDEAALSDRAVDVDRQVLGRDPPVGRLIGPG